MGGRSRNALALLRGQLWIVPTLIAVLMAGLALGVLRLTGLVPGADDAWWLYSGDAGTARELLSSLLSGMLTMTSMVVSVTFVILTLASSQLGPRLVGNFIGDRQIQIGDRQIQAVLGLFLGTILYVLLVLRSLDDTLGPAGVPHLAVTVGSALTAVSLFALLFYVHKIAKSIIADNVVKGVAAELRASTRDLLPDSRAGEEGEVPPRREPPPSAALPPQVASVALGRSGYVQTVDHDRLVEVARERGAVLRLGTRPGRFVLELGEHVAVHAAARWGDPGGRAARDAFTVGSERTPAQDLEFPVRKLVEIGVRALSPGINDPFTAVAVLDRLGAALEDALARPWPPAARWDASGGPGAARRPPRRGGAGRRRLRPDPSGGGRAPGRAGPLGRHARQLGTAPRAGRRGRRAWGGGAAARQAGGDGRAGAARAARPGGHGGPRRARAARGGRRAES